MGDVRRIGREEGGYGAGLRRAGMGVVWVGERVAELWLRGVWAGRGLVDECACGGDDFGRAGVAQEIFVGRGSAPWVVVVRRVGHRV